MRTEKKTINFFQEYFRDDNAALTQCDSSTIAIVQ